MTAAYSTHRLSPKKQVTLLRDSLAFGDQNPSQIYALPQTMKHPESGAVFPIVAVMSMEEIRRKMDAIDQLDLPPERRQIFRTKLAAGVSLPVDAQRRVVLPTPFVAHLAVDKELYMNSTTKEVHMWNPKHWQEWLDATSANAEDDAFLQGL